MMSGKYNISGKKRPIAAHWLFPHPPLNDLIDDPLNILLLLFTWVRWP